MQRPTSEMMLKMRAISMLIAQKSKSQPISSVERLITD